MQYGDINNFWFQPKPVKAEDVDSFRHNAFLKKYWRMDGSVEKSPNYINSYNLFSGEPYYNGNFSVYEQNAADDGFSYEGAYNDFQNALKDPNNQGQRYSTGVAYDAYYNANFNSYEQDATDSGFSYENEYNKYQNALNNPDNQGQRYSTGVAYDAYYGTNFAEKISGAAERSLGINSSSTQPDYDKYYNSNFN